MFLICICLLAQVPVYNIYWMDYHNLVQIQIGESDPGTIFTIFQNDVFQLFTWFLWE